MGKKRGAKPFRFTTMGKHYFFYIGILLLLIYFNVKPYDFNVFAEVQPRPPPNNPDYFWGGVSQRVPGSRTTEGQTQLARDRRFGKSR